MKNSWDKLNLCSADVNYHLFAFKYEGKRVELDLAHSVSDGGGAMPFFKSVLFCYLSKKTGEEFDPTGFRLPGDPIPESEKDFPFDWGEIEATEQPFYDKEATKDFFLVDEPEDWNINYIRLDEAEMMRFCKANDASPNAALTALIASALWRAYPACGKTLTCMIARDHKAMLGNSDNYGMYADFLTVDFPIEWRYKEIDKLCMAARGQIMAQAQPENSLYALKSLNEGMGQMDGMPLLEMKMGAVDANIAKFGTFSVSYANSRTFGPLDPYIEEVYLLAEPSAAQIICEVACINGSFFLAVSQCFASDDFVYELLEQFKAAGVTAELRRKEKLALAGVELDDIKVSELAVKAFSKIIGFLSRFQ